MPSLVVYNLESETALQSLSNSQYVYLRQMIFEHLIMLELSYPFQTRYEIPDTVRYNVKNVAIL